MKKADLSRRFGFLLHDVARLYGKKFDQRVRSLGVTRAQCRVLGYLLLNQGINQAGLAEMLEIEPISLVRLLDRMEEAGWVERRPDPTDRRARCLYLTPKAEPVFDKVLALADRYEAEMCAELSAAEKQCFLELLQKLHVRLGDRDGQPERPDLQVAAAAKRSRR
jgi:MarR family transcriptional regulator for hemolysin